MFRQIFNYFFVNLNAVYVDLKQQTFLALLYFVAFFFSLQIFKTWKQSHDNHCFLFICNLCDPMKKTAAICKIPLSCELETSVCSQTHELLLAVMPLFFCVHRLLFFLSPSLFAFDSFLSSSAAKHISFIVFLSVGRLHTWSLTSRRPHTPAPSLPASSG